MKEMAIKIKRLDGRDIKKMASCDLAMIRYGGRKERERGKCDSKTWDLDD